MKKLISFFAAFLILISFMGAETSGCGATEEGSEEEGRAASVSSENLATGEGEAWGDANVALMIKGKWRDCTVDIDCNAGEACVAGDADCAARNTINYGNCIEGIALCVISCDDDSDCDNEEPLLGLSLICDKTINSCVLKSE